MKIHTEFAQNSLEWLTARAGVVTASEFDNLLTPKFEPRKGQMPETYLARKLAERWIGPLPGFNTLDMEFGKILEEEAKPFYTLQFGEEIQSVALITSDDGKVGCSPDGLIGSDGGIEIKCPEPTNHVKHLMAGKLPDDYACQVHGSLYVTGRQWWKFMSYRRNFPPFVTVVERDTKVDGVIGEVVCAFVERLDAAYSRLCEMNGGPPVKPQPIRSAYVPDPNEVPIP
jgi:hypothetical protein